jgi:long-subunit acyl-CoA synthetase (AMP-forming)
MVEKIYRSPFQPCSLADESIWSLLFSHDNFPSAINDTAIVDAETGYAINRSELKSLTLSLAWGLRNHLPKLGGPKLARGSTIMIFSPNSVAWPVMLLGSIAAGFKCTLANSAYIPPELAHQWKDSRADLLFVYPALLQVALDMFRHLNVSADDAKKRIILASYGLRCDVPSGFFRVGDFINIGSLAQEEKFDGVNANETVLLCYSSGTTGQPKGVEVCHWIFCVMFMISFSSSSLELS